MFRKLEISSSAQLIKIMLADTGIKSFAAYGERL
jgi:hypothetical protein